MSKPFRLREDPRSEIEQALDRAIELSAGHKRATITDGRLVSEQHRRYRYTFTLGLPWDLPDGTDLQLFSSEFEKPLPVQLSQTTDESVTITTTRRLPAYTLSHAQLVVDRAYLLRRMKDALTQISTPASLGLKLFGHLESGDGVAEAHLVDTIRHIFPADEAQRLAIQRALASELLMILGPPGTGKTDVLAAIALLHAVHFKHRVLITSHTNIAIDNAILRLVKFFRHAGLERWLDEQRVIRFGDPHLAVLETDEYRHVTVPRIVSDFIRQQREQITQLECRREEVLRQIVDGQENLPMHVQAWEQRQAEIARERERIIADLKSVGEEERHHLTSILEQLTPLLVQDEREEQMMNQARESWQMDDVQLQALFPAYQNQRAIYQSVFEKWEQVRSSHRVARFFAREREEELGDRVQALAAQLTTLTEQIVPIQRRQAQAKQAYQKAEQQCKDLESAIASWTTQREACSASYEQQRAILKKEREGLDNELRMGNPWIAQIEETLKKRRRELASIEDTLARLDQRIADAKRETARLTLESAQIVGATLTGMYMNPLLLSQEWDVVIVDEGSMAPPPAVMIAANRARHHLIIVGDPLQLAPVCTFKDNLVKHWLGRDVFFHGGYTLAEAGAGTHQSILLPYQSRMHTAICDLVRGPVYKGLLKDRHPHTARPVFQPEPECAVVFYDTSEEPLAVAQKPQSGRSRSNEFHAEIDLLLAERILADLPEEHRVAECIGIVTPYTAQRDYIRKRLQETDLAPFCRVGTVHAFQGLEFAVLIFDLVESPGLEIAPFLRGGWGSDAMRLLNVAVTRALHKLFMVGNMHYVRRQRPSSLLRQIMELAWQKKHLPARHLL